MPIHRSTAAPLPAPRRLLVRGVNWLGDAVMTTPALARLREAIPGAHVTLLTAAKLGDLWRSHPAVDAVLTFEPKEGLWSVGRRLRSGNFDAALVLPNSPRSALECWLGRVPVRVGYARGWRRWWLSHPVPARPGAHRMVKPTEAEIRGWLAGQPSRAPFRPPPEAHHCHDYLTLAARFGADPAPLAPQLSVTPEEIGAARARFGLAETGVWLGLNPGAEYGPAKRWPVERFAAVAHTLATTAGVRWVLVGGPNDRALTAQIQTLVPQAIDVAGRTTLRELMAVLATCRVLLTNDTGPMHVAAALGVLVVVPFGSTSPELTGPGLPGDATHRCLRVTPAEAPCAPCFRRQCPIDFRCLLGLTVDRVVAEVRAALSTAPGRRAG